MSLVTPEQFVATVAFCDPASGKASQQVKRLSSKSSLVVVSMDAWSRVFVRMAWADRVRTTALLDKLYAVDRDFHPRPFGMEANGLQSLFLDCAQYIGAHYRGQRPAFVPVEQSTKMDKIFRIRTTLQPILGQGRLFVREEDVEVIAAIRVFPRDPVMDLIDALASACALLPKGTRSRRHHSTADDLAEYMRMQGASPQEIERRLQELEREEVSHAYAR